MSDEFLINSYSGQWQQNPDITRLADGTIVVVWDSFLFEDDLDVYYIAMQRFTAAGRPIGKETVIGAFDGGQSTHPSIIALKDGGFAVAWEVAIGDSILDPTDVYTKAFDADGTARGAATRINIDPKDDQYAASATATADGGYTVTWSSYEGPKTEKQDEIFVRHFNADGRPTGAPQLVNQFHTFDQHNSRATTLSNGQVLITWESEYAGGENPSGVDNDGVRARLYSGTGKALGDEFLLIAYNDGMNEGIGLTDSAVDVAALKDGRFVASWYQTVLHGKRDTTFDIHAQIYDNDGSKSGKEIVVHAKSEGVPDHSAITALASGGFVVAWDGFGKQTFAFEEVWARVYDDDGNALGKEFRINPPSGRSEQENPELQALPGGGFWVVYESEFLDGDDDAIAGRIYNRGDFGADVWTAHGAGDYRTFGGNDSVIGSAGADVIALGKGDDTGDGGAGDDVIVGGPGSDRLAGGAGADLFLFRAADHSVASAADTILDFESGQDRIKLTPVAGTSGVAFRWIGDAAFSHAAGELRFADGCLAADLDGDGVADFAIVVKGDPVLVTDLIL